MVQRERVIRSSQAPLRSRGRVVVPRRRLVGDVVVGNVSSARVKSAVSALSSPTPSRVKQSNQQPKPRNYTRVNRKLARAARFLAIYEELVVVNRSRDNKKKSVKKSLQNIFGGNFRKKIPVVVASILFLLSVYSFVDSWLLNGQIKDSVNTASAAARSDNSDNRRSNEGKDETRVSNEAIDKYRVAADLPRLITIEKLGVKARVLQMSVNSDGSMQSPVNIFDAGWYTGSVKPGQLGASIIVGHASGTTSGGVFNKLESLNAGDTISVERGDGQILRYQIVKKQTAKLSEVDMNNFMRPADGVTEGLNLMTCTGEWVKNSQTRDRRVMIFTKRIRTD